MAVKCTNCGGAHPSWDCSKPTKSTVPVNRETKPSRVADGLPDRPAVDTLPKPKIGRPRTGFNKKEYNRQFTADLRTIKRLGLNCTVREWREKNEKQSS
jgi:hypothetical protein